MVIKRSLKDPLYYGLLLYVIAAFVLGFTYSNGLILFLGWNLILAGIAYFLSHLFRATRESKKPLYLSIIILFFFILFFPNTIYVMTDFIHLQSYNFFFNYPSVYTFQLMDWMVVLMITSGALLAAKFGVSAIENIRPYLYIKVKQYFIASLSFLFLISSVGIYIGRFIRLNSWEFHKILDVIPLLFENFSFFIGFVMIYFIIHWTSYLVMANHHKEGYNRINENVED